MQQDLNRLVAELVAHLRENPAWADGYSHEGWIGVETASYFRRKLSSGVGREVPYVIAPRDGTKVTKYADVYVRYYSATEPPVHLFFEFKCVPALAASWKATLSDFAADVDQKLAHLDVIATRLNWTTGADAWCRNLGELRSTMTDGRVIGIGMLFAALDEERREQLRLIRDRLRTAHAPTTSILDQELQPMDDQEKSSILGLAYGVSLA